jgi:ribosomal protein S18 acetylase RimI-like enzyme
MSEVIRDLSSKELIPALESNLAGFWSAYGRVSGCTLHSTPEVVWFYTGMRVELFNGVVLARLKSDDVKGVVDSLQSKLNEQGTPALWWLGPASTPANLGKLLEGYGLQAAGGVPGMAADLAGMSDTPKGIQNFEIQKVTNPEMQAAWGRIAAIGSGFPHLSARMAQLEASLSDPVYRAQPRYIGFLDGAPVATSAMVLESGVAGIYAVATIPEARRKGIGETMTLVPLLEARQNGYQVGILQASPMGYPIYKRLGFKDICKFDIYLQSG